jgi:putative oxidoreductase
MALGELGIGVGLITGFLTPVAAAGAVAITAVAYWTVHRPAGFFITARPDEGWEYVFVLAVTAVAVATLGPGEWSLDYRLDWSLSGGVGAVIALSGVAAAALQISLFFRAKP